MDASFNPDTRVDPDHLLPVKKSSFVYEDGIKRFELKTDSELITSDRRMKNNYKPPLNMNDDLA